MNSILPSFTEKLENLREEVVSYYEKAVIELHSTDQNMNHADLCDNLWRFWRRNELLLPFWSEAANHIALIMTSFGAVERSFSLYLALFGDNRESALKHVRELSVLKRYNFNRV